MKSTKNSGLPKTELATGKIISPSRIAAFLECGEAHRLRYDEGIQARRPPLCEAALLGKYIHDYMEEILQNGFPDVYNVDLQPAPLGIAMRAVRWLQKRFKTIEVVGTEFKVSADLPDASLGAIGGQVDALLRLDDKLVLIDWKTTKYLPQDTLDLSHQTAAYLYCLREAGIKPDRAGLFYIRSEAVNVKYTAKGVISKQSKLDHETIEKLGLDMKQTSDWQSDFTAPVNWDMVDALVANMQVAVRNMAIEQPMHIRASTFGCMRCEFLSLCLAKLRGEDPSNLTKIFFETRTKR